MSITFKKAPLVEIIAELRWGDLPQLTPQPNMAFQIGRPIGSKLDEFFMRFAGEIYQHGFNRVERLVPPQFPTMMFQPVYRYRKTSEADDSVLYQLGHGLFTAHAIPPYRSWDTFAPVVRAGIDALLKAREGTEKALGFTSVSLRYIDAFKPALTGGRNIGAFIRDVLGFTITLPNALSKHITSEEAVKSALQFVLPLSNEMSMNISIGEALVNNEAAVMMDMTIASTTKMQPDGEALMSALNAARTICHDIFFDITKPIHALMQPTDGQ